MALAATTTNKYSGSYNNNNNGRRKSAASISVIIENNNKNQNFFLSPNSAFSENFKSEKRRNSYAGDNKIPELFIYSPAEALMSPTMASHSGNGGGGNLQQQQHFLTPMGSFRRRLPPTPLDLANGRLSGSQDALLLIPSPEDIINNNNNNGSITLPPSRRTSSPRILPTPPSPQQQYSPNSKGSQNSPMNLSYIEDNPTSPFERRRSVRRQLPQEPQQLNSIIFEQPQLINNLIDQKLENNLNYQKIKKQIKGIATLTIIENVENINGLKRSYSTKNNTKKIKQMTEEENKREESETNKTFTFQTSPNHQLSFEQIKYKQNNELITTTNNNNLIIKPPLLKTPSSNNLNSTEINTRTLSNRKMKEETTTDMLQHQRLSLTEQTDSLPLYPTTRPVASSLGANTMIGPKISFSKPKLTLNNNKKKEEEEEEENNYLEFNNLIKSSRPSLTSTTSSNISPSIITSSAPNSPRELYSSSSNCSSSRKFSASSGSACSSADSSSHTQQSAALTDLAAISALNSRCNRSGPGSGINQILLHHFLHQWNRIISFSFSFSAQLLHSSVIELKSPIFNAFPSFRSSHSTNSMNNGNNNNNKLNCNSTVTGSRSGSDVEISTADPSVLGFDPSLYVNRINNQNIQSSPMLITTNNNGTIPSTSTNGDLQLHHKPKGLGLLHCTLQHFPVRKRLRFVIFNLRLLSLAGELRPDLEIQPFCKLTLTSTKKQQSQQQSVVKRGRDAVFNQEFFFDNFTTEEIELKQLQIEVCHSSNQKLQRDLDIGEVRIPLIDLSPQLQTKKEVHIVEELKIFISTKKLGKLYITTCIEKADRRLTINLIKVEDLPKWGIIGAPDIQIRIRMQQSNNPEVIKCSRIIKNTTSAVYKEAVMFLVSTREADLARTKITISVHDLSRSVTGNDIIGFVFLGELASDKSEIDQWRSTMDHWGKEYKAVHTLKCPSSRCQQPSLHYIYIYILYISIHQQFTHKNSFFFFIF
ncbi:C2 domain-containing protein [Meloidogyne graminicola]|uniref:C2 domain-containing protein n=1 Tax=Meloidogyne graminicola TaxID=189291 RepID=A0A8T0A2D2_9BILA|nr:C2 domain-containing protein [Meloidogyne graminicola]